MFVYAISARQLKNLISQYEENGLSEQVHGNAMKQPHNRTDGEKVQKIKEFIERFADNDALPLPGRLPTHKDY